MAPGRTRALRMISSLLLTSYPRPTDILLTSHSCPTHVPLTYYATTYHPHPTLAPPTSPHVPPCGLEDFSISGGRGGIQYFTADVGIVNILKIP